MKIKEIALYVVCFIAAIVLFADILIWRPL
jgi:hypothetical protein